MHVVWDGSEDACAALGSSTFLAPVRFLVYDDRRTVEWISPSIKADGSRCLIHLSWRFCCPADAC